MGSYKQYSYEGERRDFLRKVFVLSLLVIEYVFGMIILFLYLYHHPFHPEVSVEAATLAGINPSGRSNDSHSYELALNVSLTIPHGSCEDKFCYDTIEGRAYDGNQELGYVPLPSALCLSRCNQSFASLAFSGWNSSTAGGPAERARWFVGVVKIRIRGRLMAYFGKLKTYIEVCSIDGVAECRVEVPLPSDGNASARLQRTRCLEKFHGF